MGKKKVEVSMVDLQSFIEATIKKAVNGKIDMVGEHLKRQDTAIEGLTKAWDQALFLLKSMGYVIGGLSSLGALYLIGYQVLQTFH